MPPEVSSTLSLPVSSLILSMLTRPLLPVRAVKVGVAEADPWFW